MLTRKQCKSFLYIATYDLLPFNFALLLLIWFHCQDSAGDAQSRTFELTKKSNCVFQPVATPRKVQSSKPPTWEDAGSLIAVGKTMTQLAAGEIRVVPHWMVSNSNQGFALNPEKPGIYVATDVVIPAGKIAKLL